MKILLDTCVSRQTKELLMDTGHDVIWVGDFPKDPGDDEILLQANRENRVLVTMDKDFGELAVLSGLSHCGIVRLVNFRLAEQNALCLKILSQHATDLAEGALITAEPGRIRVRLKDK